MTNVFIEAEFNRQAENLLQKKYPQLVGISSDEFIKSLDVLKPHLSKLTHSEINLDEGKLPFVIVVKSELADVEKKVSLIDYAGKQSITKMYPHIPGDFKTIDTVSLPDKAIYLLMDIDRGKDTLNIPPNEALERLLSQQRSPLTIDEGVAILTQYPEFIQKNNCFSLLASRMEGNQSVPALWITGEKTVRLGWCWEKNPHTWLGSASCKKRLG